VEKSGEIALNTSRDEEDNMEKEKINLLFEEYKLLKEESRNYTDSNWRDFQIIITIATVVISLSNLGFGTLQVPASWSYMVVQLFIYFFLLIQLSRLVYLFTLRIHLSDLENRLNVNNIGELSWESRVVPQQLMKTSSLNLQAQIIMGFVYSLLFISFLVLSVGTISQVDNLALRLIFGGIDFLEVITLGYIGARLLFKKL
jgi:hypothetical protein